MEEIDDFGDLYADVEALVSSVINGGGRDIKADDNHVAIEQCGIDEGFIADSKVNLDDDGSDSEDDLNIVLNDDDFRPVNGGVRNGGVVGGGSGNRNDKDGDFVGSTNGIGSDKNRSDEMEQGAAGTGAVGGNGRHGIPCSQLLQYEYIARHARSRPFRSTAKDNRFAGVRGDWKNIQSNGDKCSGSSQVARFELPRKRTRTILNANIDKFAQKPWRNCGVDVTDFFNFGFNEQSWKEYCSSVACEAQLEYEEMSQEAIANETAQAGQGRTDNPDHASEFTAVGVTHLELPKGRAIQVKGSIGERQSSMDVKHPLGLDSDVVIQITGQDTTEKYSGSDKEELDHKYNALYEGSEKGKFSIDANGDTCVPRSAGGDKMFTVSFEGSIRTSDRHAAALRRCSQQGSSINPTSMDSDNWGNGQFSDLERKHDKKIQFSEGNTEAIESRSNENEVKDPCMLETESSYGGQVQLSPFGSQSESSEDDAYIASREIQKPFRRPSQNPVAELRDSDEPGYNLLRDSDINNATGKPGYFKQSARRNRSPIRERRTLCSRRFHGEADGGGDSPMSDKEVKYTKDHSYAIRGRQHGKLHGIGSYHKEYISFYRENYHTERFADDHFRNCNSKRSYEKHHPRFKNETDPNFKRKCSERGYFHERRITTERGSHHRESGVAVKDMDCPMYRNRKWVSKYSFYTHKGKDTRWRTRNDEHYFKRRNEGGAPWLECRHADGFTQGKNRKAGGHANGFTQGKNHCAVPFFDREGDCYDERCSRYDGSKVKNFGRGERYDESPTPDLDYSRFRGIQNNVRRHVDRRLLSSRFYSESHTTDGGRWPNTVSPGDDVDDLGLTDGHGRSRRGTFAERCRDGDICDSYNDADDCENGITSPSNQVQSGRRGHYKQSKAFHLAEDELFSSHEDDKFYDEASFSNKKVSRHEKIHATNRSSHGRMAMDHKQTEQHIYEMTRGRNAGHFFDAGSNPSRSVKHEQRVLTGRNSVDLVAGKGKSPERCTEAENAMCNDKLEDMSSERDVEHTPKSMEFNDFQTEKVEIGSNQDIEEWLDKFPVLEDNEALDLEEGQIITDELDMDFLMEENRALENAAPPAGNVRERMLEDENAADVNEVFEGIDQDRILESLAKMEKRRERFKEPLLLRKEQDKNPEPQSDPEIETAETNQQRPTRKRLWGGSYAPLDIGR